MWLSFSKTLLHVVSYISPAVRSNKNSYLIQNTYNYYKSNVVEENSGIPPLPRKFGENPH